MSLVDDHLAIDRPSSEIIAVPARTAMERAESSRRRLGHENLGFLSERYGFMPFEEPLKRLPAGFAAWDELAARLPELYRSLRLRRELDALPLLDAGPEALPDHCLLRAALVLSYTAHSYWHVENRPPDRLPASLELPFAQVRARLGRAAPTISFLDMLYNWRLVDRGQPDRRRVDNMDLLVPTAGNREEHVFYLTAVEIVAESSPMIAAMVRAQEAVAAEDTDALELELLILVERLERLQVSLAQIDPNPRGGTHVDPVVWARTVASLFVPPVKGEQGASGLGTPTFSALDAFLGRRRFDSYFGNENRKQRESQPPNWQDFFHALCAVSVPGFVARTGNRTLVELLRQVGDTYAGPGGLLARHRMKASGFMELAFKIGRSMTITGHEGVFIDRTWEVVNAELDESRLERPVPAAACHRAMVKRVIRHAAGTADEVSEVVLDISGLPLRFRAGDRCCVLPENSDALVDRTLAALGATGDEPVELTPEWRAAAATWRDDGQPVPASTVRELLRHGHLHPMTEDTTLALSDLISDGDGPDALCSIVPPAAFRPYSISSAPDGTELRLTVSRLRYPSPDGDLVHGTASTFLATAAGRTEPVSIRIERAPRFGLPADPTTPIVMIAGGSGIAPFRGFLAERMRATHPGEAWLLLGLRNSPDITRADDLVAAVRSGMLRLDVAYSRPATGPSRRIGDLLADNANRLRDLLRTTEAHVYVCGGQGFVRSAMAALQEALGDGLLLDQLAADGRLELETFAGHDPDEDLPQLDWSDIALRNDERNGHWLAIDGRVYDVDEFMRRHPGGVRVMRSWAGTDASKAYARSHHGRADVDAMRELHAIGRVRRLDLPEHAVPMDGPDGPLEVSASTVHLAWTAALHLVVEMQNALVHDHLLPHLTTTRDDPMPSRSPFNLQLAIETHERFLSSYLDLLLDETFENLWALTRTRFAPAFAPSWLRDRVAAVRDTDDARRLGTAIPVLYRALDDAVARGVGAEAMVPFVEACAIIAESDRELLDRVKGIARAAVAVFEDLGRRVDADGAPRLVAAFEELPAAVGEYHAALRRRLGDDRQLADRLHAGY